MTNLVLLEKLDSGVAIITFNRPEKKNAFKQDMWMDLSNAIVDVKNDDAIRVLILTGAGKDFCSGVDLSDFGGDPDKKPKFEVMMDELVEFDKPLLAAAKGVAIGFGATALFHCDIVYVGESLKMRLPFVNLGLVPEAASSYTLQAIIGRQAAAELLLTAEWIDAGKAKQFDLCREIYKDDEVLAKTIEKAAQIAKWPVNALRETKRCITAPHKADIEAARQREMKGMMKQVGSAENIEAITAFLEKREPRF
jgi:enoyl-CoA hydratase/carnithine racemase